VNKQHQAQASASHQSGREIQKGCTLKKPTLCWVGFLSVPIRGGKQVLLHRTMFISQLMAALAGSWTMAAVDGGETVLYALL
jgi:hypothetical protein